MNHYDYAFGFQYAEQTNQIVDKKRIKLSNIQLVGKKPLVDKKIVFKEVADLETNPE